MFGKEKKITARNRDFLHFRFFGLSNLPSSDVVKSTRAWKKQSYNASDGKIGLLIFTLEP